MTIRELRHVGWMIAGVAALSLLAACDRQESAKPGSTAAVQEKTIRIGATFPLTGDVASYGQKAKRGIELAVAQKNDEGGLLGRQVRVAFQDDRGDSRGEGRSVAVAGVPMIRGSARSVAALAVTLAADLAPARIASDASSLDGLGGAYE